MQRNREGAANEARWAPFRRIPTSSVLWKYQSVVIGESIDLVGKKCVRFDGVDRKFFQNKYLAPLAFYKLRGREPE
jgi:hypothetical protein